MLALLLSGCECGAPVGAPISDAMPPWDVGGAPPPTRPSMVWVPAGVLIAGTPPGSLPRIADEELPGVAIPMNGFFIDAFNYPAEAGALPLTGITQARARAICEKSDKRLCTELEWERACKGPGNLLYDYGNRHDPSACSTGRSAALAPNGASERCVTGFGVHDMHGSAWNWTSSAWGRGSKDSRVAVRGGNGRPGDLVGRCANARPQDPAEPHPTVGVRCCAGDVNDKQVALDVSRGSELAYRPFDPAIADQLNAFVPDAIKEAVKGRPDADAFRVERLWMWRPIGNEMLVIGGGCAHPPGHDACGVVVARLEGKAVLLDFVSSDWWIPTVGVHEESRTLYLYGGDIGGAYRKPLIYEWGRIGEGTKFRRGAGSWKLR